MVSFMSPDGSPDAALQTGPTGRTRGGPGEISAMTQHQTSRTLVKSPPELWAECSDAGSLARHLGAFGEIRITKLEPETTVAWEGAAARGTVTLEPSGWGTRVTLTLTEEEQAVTGSAASAAPAAEEQASVADPPLSPAEDPAPPVAPTDEPDPAPPGLWARLVLRLRGGGPPEPAPASSDLEAAADTESAAPPEPPAPARADPAPGEGTLAAALDSLGRAHHRPYSRA